MIGGALKSKIKNFLKSGHERTLNIKKNIIYSFLIKGLSVLIGYSLFPLTIHYVNSVQYGLWLTIASMVAWMNTFDIGLSNGLRNKLAEAIALNDNENIKKYVSTTYLLLLLIASAAFGLFFIGGSFFNWNQLLQLKNTINFNIWPVVLTNTWPFLRAVCITAYQQYFNSYSSTIQSIINIFSGTIAYIISDYFLNNANQRYTANTCINGWRFSNCGLIS